MKFSPRTTQPLIGLCGGIGSGKDSAADHLVSHYGFVKLSFADKLKWLCMDLFDLTQEQAGFGTQEEKAEPVPHLGVVSADCGLMGDPWVDRVGLPWCGRWVLEWMGTNAARTVWGPVWVNAVRKQIKFSRENAGHNGYEHCAVIADVRFQNEAEMIWDLGGLVLRTQVDGKEPERTGHTSDNWWPEAQVDFELVAPKPGLDILCSNVDYVMGQYRVDPL